MDECQPILVDWMMIAVVVIINIATTAFYFMTSRDLKRIERHRRFNF